MQTLLILYIAAQKLPPKHQTLKSATVCTRPTINLLGNWSESLQFQSGPLFYVPYFSQFSGTSTFLEYTPIQNAEVSISRSTASQLTHRFVIFFGLQNPKL